MQSFLFGKTVSGAPILGYRFGSQQSLKKVLILGGVHGDEPEGVWAASALIEALLVSQDFRHLDISVIPCLNVDGVLLKQRGNLNGIDLNRNMATKDFTSHFENPRYNPGPFANSEPETQALENYVLSESPHLIVSLHSWKPVLNVNGACLNTAQIIAEQTGYAIEDNIGYPTPGCLGTFCGLERNMPTLTYEIERGQAPQDLIHMHPPAILKALKQL